ncbi:MAG: MarR family transcriptional regulator [Clostridia bacterium]|nr:MarR family transcriptional regulator [Clostridia bacterium]
MDEHVSMYFKKISEKLEKRANESLPKCEFTFTQGKVLWYLHKHENETVTLRDIERFLDCSHATVSGLVSRLESKGLVAIEQNKQDRRAKNVTLTERELSNFRAMKKHRKEMEETLLCGFSEEERAVLLGYLKRVYENL